MKYAAKICGIRPRLYIRIIPTYGNGEGGEVTKVHTSTSFFPLLALTTLI